MIEDEWHIVVPVYNEEANLEHTIAAAEQSGYADRITFVNDASTDRSGEILDAASERLGIRVHHLQENRCKEGAIRAVLERLAAAGSLPGFTILLDADSFFKIPKGDTLLDGVADAISHMNQENIVGMAFRINAAIPPIPSFLQGCVYTDYSGSQIDNRMTSVQWRLWVINGPGGIFRSDELIWSLRRIKPDFETGDLIITVLLMAKHSRVAFWPHLRVETNVPSSYGEYFRQRRRWERGTVKVLWNERRFYLRLLSRPQILSVTLLLYLIFPLGVVSMLLSLPFVEDPVRLIWGTIAVSSFVWCGITVAKCIANRLYHSDARGLLSVGFALPNAILFLAVTGPARVAGFCDAIRYFSRRRYAVEVDSSTISSGTESQT